MPGAKNGPGHRWRTLAVDVLYDIMGNALYAVAICVFANMRLLPQAGFRALPLS